MYQILSRFLINCTLAMRHEYIKRKFTCNYILGKNPPDTDPETDPDPETE